MQRTARAVDEQLRRVVPPGAATGSVKLDYRSASDAVLMRPSVLAVFDTLKDELYLTAPVYIRDGVIPDRHLAIGDRTAPTRDDAPFPTHAEALAYAIAAVGLDTPPEHREAP